jgi:hypothetical protein
MTDKKKGVTVYFQQEDLKEFKLLCKKNDVTMAAKLLEQAKSFIKRESKKSKSIK